MIHSRKKLFCRSLLLKHVSCLSITSYTPLLPDAKKIILFDNFSFLPFGQVYQTLCIYRKLVETFHNVSEFKTVIYLCWWFTLEFVTAVVWIGIRKTLQFATAVVWIGSPYSSGGQVILTVSLLASLHFLTDQKIHLATETEQDRTRLSLLQYIKQKFTFGVKAIIQSNQYYCHFKSKGDNIRPSKATFLSFDISFWTELWSTRLEYGKGTMWPARLK